MTWLAISADIQPAQDAIRHCPHKRLSESLGWHRARMTFMAGFVLSALQLTTTNLRRIAVSLKAGVQEDSNYRRIRRFLADYDVDYAALSRLLVRPVPVQITVRRVGSDAKPLKDRFLVLATSGLDPTRAPALYWRRWEVETLFAALKSRGFNLEATHLTASDRMRRLIGLLAVAFAWSHLVGEKRAEIDGLPPRKAHGRWSGSERRFWCLYRPFVPPTHFCPVLRVED